MMSDNNIVPQIKYDVFVSFRGGDIRDSFLSHLTEAFDMKRIYAFVDEKLEKGEEIWPSLVGAIEASSMSLIIFSQDYASSRWCLEELETILKCREKFGQTVIPVFYKVEPRDVGHQSSQTYKNAFAEHERKYGTKVQVWREALSISAKISGFVSSNFQTDAQLVKETINLVLKNLDKPLVNLKRLVGIKEKIADVESLIRKEPKHTRLIGIWGMGGIGKTALAEEVFIKLRSEYQGYLFLANEREQTMRHEIISLKKKIFSELLGNDLKIDTPNSLPDDIVRRIRRMRVFIVLDDVNDSDHLEKLLGPLDNFGPGSRIIVTTRDEQVLKANKAGEIYRLGELSFDKALELFNLNAFNQCDDQRKYDELSKKVVMYAKGIPLVLNEMAHLLRAKNMQVWESELGELVKMPLRKVYDRMKLSYDDLEHREQQIFLDLACYFCRSHPKIKMSYLKSLLEESVNSVDIELEKLKDKALITFSEDNFVSMHDSLQKMAWEIVRRESTEPGSRSRLWDHDDIYEALKNDKVTEAIRSIQIDLPKIKEQKLMPHIFSKMGRLKFLEISGEDNYDCYNQLILAEEPLFLASELRFLHWDYYPLKSLPGNFSAEKLVILKLLCGKMEKLWDGVKNLVNLKEVDLSGSNKLKELPDLSKATNLEVLVLHYCSMLTSVHPSVFSLEKLEKLDLSRCGSLTIVTSNSHVCNLSYLNLDRCKNVTEFSLILENMKELRLGWTKLKALPSSFGHQSKLKSLHLKGSAIESLPSSFNNLNQLLHLELSNCTTLQTIVALPPFLKTLNMQSCISLKTLPELPLSLKTLNVTDCKSLKTVLFPSMVAEQLKENKKRVRFWNCLNLDEHSLVAIGFNVQINAMKYANQHLSTPNHDCVENYHDYDSNHRSYQAVYVYPGSSVPEWLEYKTTKDNIIIDLSTASPPPPPSLGFIFGFVFGEYLRTDNTRRIEVNIAVSEDKQDSVTMYIDFEGWEIESDHVCVVYDQRCSSFINRRAKNQTRFKIEVTMVVRDYALQQGYNRGVRFGVSPISTSTYSSFIEQMELYDSVSSSLN